ncbi:hypothetical protein [Virgisporangium aurantiacum]|uniref:Uncharacterized protein n=1 Tax=Virgisporangium aurantiacum TaxID=175570 RepID=A0A8J3ZDU5_9ACTN|nr:hypothetical protein [Virgisporangium aurantiacum]GIJ62086.1 hypothetical protein Vau01_096020 [Virgisporangium aurantiacum]
MEEQKHSDAPVRPVPAAATSTGTTGVDWSPEQHGLMSVYPGSLWQRDNRDATVTYAVVVPPKLRPGWDGGPWRDDELWLVCVPADTVAARTILDKPHRVTWILDRVGVERDTDTAEEYDTLGFGRSTVLHRGPVPSGLRSATHDGPC